MFNHDLVMINSEGNSVLYNIQYHSFKLFIDIVDQFKKSYNDHINLTKPKSDEQV